MSIILTTLFISTDGDILVLGPTAEEVRARRQYPSKPGGRGSGQCDALRSIPGLVGDSRMRDEIGHKKSGRER